MSEQFAQGRLDFLTDKRLGPWARLLGVYWADKPAGWVIQESDAHKQLGTGSAAYKTAMRELKQYGYVEAGVMTRDPKGRVRTAPPSINADLIKPQVTPKVGYRTSVTDTSVVGPVNHTDTHRESHTDSSSSNKCGACGEECTGPICEDCYQVATAGHLYTARRLPDAEVAPATVSGPAPIAHSRWDHPSPAASPRAQGHLSTMTVMERSHFFASGACGYCGKWHRNGEECPKVLAMEGRSDDY